jgi:serine/threonine-protein kinase
MSHSDGTIGIRPGDVLDGKYRIDGVLGAGAMGIVVAAHHLQLDERVALKFLTPSALDSAEATARFAREARATAKIKSEHVARVFDVGTLDSGAPYIVMEYLEGTDLNTWLTQHGPMPVPQAVEFVLQACEAIAEAHSQGIIHRDLKPSNLFVGRRNDGGTAIKVLDFGISKITCDGDVTTTGIQAVMGSPCYMSPEQLGSSKDVSPQSDIWAIGVVLFELIAGQLPFCGETLPAICLKIASEPPPPLRMVVPDAPPLLEAVISKCLERDRARRYEDVAELALALRDFAPKRARVSVERILGILHRPVEPSMPPPPPGIAHDPTVIATMAPYGRTTTGWEPRGRKRTAALGVAAALAAVLGFAILHRGGLPRAGARASAALQAGVAPIPTELNPSPSEVNLPPIVVLPPPSMPVPAEGPKADPDVEVLPGRHAQKRVRSANVPARQSVASPPSSIPSPAAPVSAPATSRAPSADCDPPFYFDETGIRVFKKECVH